MTLRTQEMIDFEIRDNLAAAFPETNAVLAKHGLAGTVGLQVIHDHFPMSDSEVLMEEVDEDGRSLTFRPVDRDSQDPAGVFVSTWNPATGRSVQRCPRTQACHEIIPTDPSVPLP